MSLFPLIFVSCLWNLVEVRLTFFCLKYMLYIYFFPFCFLFHIMLFSFFFSFLFIYFILFYFILLLSLFNFNSFQIIHLSSSFFLMNCGICANRKWNYPLVSLLPFIFASCSQTLVKVRRAFV